MTEEMRHLLQVKRVVVTKTIKRPPLLPQEAGHPAEALGLHQAAAALEHACCVRQRGG